MLMFLALAIVLAILAVIAFTVLGALGGTLLFIFADVIVCIAIIVLLIKFIKNRRK